MIKNNLFSSTRQQQAGFTLIELIVVMVFAAIIMTFAIPNFKVAIRNNRLSTQTNDLVSSLNLARSEAVTRGDRITICRSLNGTSCNTSTGNWEDGWIVFHDPLTSGTVGVVDSGEQLIRVYAGLDGDNTLRAGDNFTDYISYLAMGESAGNAADTDPEDDEFRLCDSRGDASAYTIEIMTTGRVQSSRTANCP